MDARRRRHVLVHELMNPPRGFGDGNIQFLCQTLKGFLGG